MNIINPTPLLRCVNHVYATLDTQAHPTIPCKGVLKIVLSLNQDGQAMAEAYIKQKNDLSPLHDAIEPWLAIPMRSYAGACMENSEIRMVEINKQSCIEISIPLTQAPDSRISLDAPLLCPAVMNKLRQQFKRLHWTDSASAIGSEARAEKNMLTTISDFTFERDCITHYMVESLKRSTRQAVDTIFTRAQGQPLR